MTAQPCIVAEQPNELAEQAGDAYIFAMPSSSRLTDRLRRFLPAPLRNRRARVHVVRLSGVIAASSGLRQSLSIGSTAGVLERAFRDKPDAVALVINSPGGSAAQSHLIHQRIRSLAVEHAVPVYAFVEDVAASGGYMIATAADEIIADPSSIVGSIGVVAAGFGFEKLIEKVGVQRRVYTAGDSKGMLDPFLPEKAEDIAHLKAMQAEVHRLFIALVQARRSDRLAQNEPALFSGAFWDGGRAVSLGLVDRLGDLRGVMREKFGEKVRLTLVEPRRGLLSGRVPGTQLSSAEAGLVSGLHDLMAERALWGRFGL